MSTARNILTKSEMLKQNEENQEEKVATWEDAVKFRNKWRVMNTSGSQPVQYNIGCDLSELTQFGPGLRLFFEFLKYSAITFLIMSLISIPSLVSNAQGSGLDSVQLSTNTLSKISLSNQKQMALNSPAKGASAAQVEAVRVSNQAIIDQYVVDTESRLKQVAIPDIIYSGIFFIFIVLFTYHSIKIAKQSASENIVPSKYAIEVSGFPSTITDSNVILTHFSKHFGIDIYECSMARCYYNTLFLHKKEAELIDSIRSEKQRVKTLKITNSDKLKKQGDRLAQIQSEIQKIVQKKLKGQVLPHDQYPSLKAFLIFNNAEDKVKIQKEYNKIWKFLCFSNRPESFKLLGKHNLKLSFKPDEPSNILWENIEVSSFSRFQRTLVVIILVIIIMLISFAIIIVANIVKPSSQASCPKNTISLSEAETSDYYMRCYCTGQSFSTITSNSRIQNLCWDVWVEYATTYALTVVTGIVILIVNFLLKKMIEALGKFNRYNTVTKFITSMTSKLFIAFFVNTALITLFLQANIYGFIPAVTFTKPIPPLSDLQSKKEQQFSPDFDRNWYMSIGSKITVTVFFFIVNHAFFEFILIPLWNCLKERKVRKIVGNDIQRAANKVIIGPEFSLTYYYSAALNIIFTALFYSSGMPIMLFGGFVILTVQYWVYKYRLLRVCRRPPSFDVGINNRVLEILPWSLIFHLLVGLYMYGQPLIFPNSSSQLVLQMNKTTTSTTSDYDVIVSTNETETVKTRAYNVIYLFIFLLVVVALFIIRSIFSNIKLIFSYCCGKAYQVAPTSEAKLYRNEYQKIEARTLASYDMKINDDYRLIVQAIDLGHKLNDTPRNKNSIAQTNGEEVKLKAEDVLDKI